MVVFDGEDKSEEEELLLEVQRLPVPSRWWSAVAVADEGPVDTKNEGVAVVDVGGAVVAVAVENSRWPLKNSMPARLRRSAPMRNRARLLWEVSRVLLLGLLVSVLLSRDSDQQEASEVLPVMEPRRIQSRQNGGEDTSCQQ